MQQTRAAGALTRECAYAHVCSQMVAIEFMDAATGGAALAQVEGAMGVSNMMHMRSVKDTYVVTTKGNPAPSVKNLKAAMAAVSVAEGGKEVVHALAKQVGGQGAVGGHTGEYRFLVAGQPKRQVRAPDPHTHAQARSEHTPTPRNTLSGSAQAETQVPVGIEYTATLMTTGSEGAENAIQARNFRKAGEYTYHGYNMCLNCGGRGREMARPGEEHEATAAKPVHDEECPEARKERKVRDAPFAGTTAKMRDETLGKVKRAVHQEKEAVAAHGGEAEWLRNVRTGSKCSQWDQRARRSMVHLMRPCKSNCRMLPCAYWIQQGKASTASAAASDGDDEPADEEM